MGKFHKYLSFSMKIGQPNLCMFLLIMLKNFLRDRPTFLIVDKQVIPGRLVLQVQFQNCFKLSSSSYENLLKSKQAAFFKNYKIKIFVGFLAPYSYMQQIFFHSLINNHFQRHKTKEIHRIQSNIARRVFVVEK